MHYSVDGSALAEQMGGRNLYDYHRNIPTAATKSQKYSHEFAW